MSELTTMLTNFNKAFNVPVNRKPSLLKKNEFNLRYNLLLEEINEYKDACEEENLVKVSDAIIDIAYVLYGAVVSHGLEKVFYDMFEEVHKSNMSKLENGKVLKRSDGKVMKGSEYFKPNLKQFLDE
jgi:predicted HAD superfamily Cof-like phosphohydrolase|tara:strand:- start:2128 stop:2508 length:381 start_codon:yes stop_codon:yes gene_type:complete